MLRVQYQSPPVEVVAYARGGTGLRVLDDPRAYARNSEGQHVLAELRAECQNNLKQFGLVIKMYSNEHEDYTPPGWLSTYPEYATDPAMYTSPADPIDAGFYEYLLPATNIEGFLDESVADEEDPAARAKAMSKIPVVINRKNWPGPSGRNILFADGHVEYSRSWEEVLARIR